MKTEQIVLRIEEDLMEDIKMHHSNFEIMTSAKLSQAEFIRTLLRYGIQVMSDKCMDDQLREVEKQNG